MQTLGPIVLILLIAFVCFMIYDVSTSGPEKITPTEWSPVDRMGE